MKKEKTIKTYQRKTKSGKITTVKSHTAKYDAAAEVAKKAARKKGAGGELKTRLTKMPDPKLELQNYLDELKKPVGGGITGLEPKESKKTPAKKQKKTAPKSSGLSSTEFKAWYHDPKSKEGKAAAKKLKEQVGAEKYKELNKKANDSYSSRGHISLFKSIGSDSTSKTAPKKTLKKPVGGGITGLEPKKKSTSSKDTDKGKLELVKPKSKSPSLDSLSKTQEKQLRTLGNKEVRSSKEEKDYRKLHLREAEINQRNSSNSEFTNWKNSHNQKVDLANNIEKEFRKVSNKKSSVTNPSLKSAENTFFKYPGFITDSKYVNKFIRAYNKASSEDRKKVSPDVLKAIESVRKLHKG